jgi:hypothetical protein
MVCHILAALKGLKIVVLDSVHSIILTTYSFRITMLMMRIQFWTKMNSSQLSMRQTSLLILNTKVRKKSTIVMYVVRHTLGNDLRLYVNI